MRSYIDPEERSQEAPASSAQPTGHASETPRTDWQPDWDNVHADADLVRRCVAGEVPAWETLYEQCHPPLLRSVACMIPGGRPDPNLVEELAARVWYALVAEDAELLARFDSRRGARLTTFIRAIALDVTSRHFRSEQRRRRREREGSSDQPYHDAHDVTQLQASWDEFRQTLTRAERRFLDRHLDAVEDDGETSQAYALKLASRVRRKLRMFLGL